MWDAGHISRLALKGLVGKEGRKEGRVMVYGISLGAFS